MTVIALAPQDDDVAVIDAVASLLKDSFPLNRLAMSPGHAPADFWPQVGALGWIIAPLDEGLGGGGVDSVQEMLMHREFGRWLAPVGLLAAALAARVYAQTSGEIPAEILEGAARVGVAIPLSPAPLGERPQGAVQLIDADANHFLIATPEGAAVVRREVISGWTRVNGIDPTVTLARGVIPELDGWLASATDPVGLRMQLLLAGQLTGIALAASAMAAGYARVREQFGKPIGAFQAVAHLCADATVRARASDASLALAAIAVRDGWEDRTAQTVAAFHVAAEAAMLASTNNIQVHGGMGYSAESGAHLFLKRAVLLKRLAPFRHSANDILLGSSEG